MRAKRWLLAATATAATITSGVLGAPLDILAPPTDLGGSAGAEVDYSAHSLYQGPAPRPGPTILYAAPPRAPQLENVGVWKARPILISGASAYRKGEFLYQDYLYDDHGANGGANDPTDAHVAASAFSSTNGTYTYPADPAYANNAADLVELRLKPRTNEIVFRVTLNSLKDPARIGFTLAIGESAASREFPNGANVRAPAALFLTVHGQQAELIDATDGHAVTPTPTVMVDLERRQFEVHVATAAWNPANKPVRLAAGVGLWDLANNRYLIPVLTATATSPGGAGTLTRPPAFFNVAFRFNEPMPNPNQLTNTGASSWWRDKAQGTALNSGDISQFSAVVDFAKLANGVDDDMPGQPQGVPQHGAMNRILASRFATRQGVDFANQCGQATSCEGELLGQLQPYAIYVPVKSQPALGYGLTLLLHALDTNYNQYLGSRHQSELGERGSGHITITPAGRGPDGWYVDHAEADTFEVWSDVARNYPLNSDMTSISGYSMGGYGTFKFAARYPDLFAKAHTIVGPPGLGIWAPPAEPTGTESTNTFHLLPSVRNIPFLMWVQASDELVPYTGTRMQAQGFDDLGYRYRFDTFTPGEHLTFALQDEYTPGAKFLGDAIVDRNPFHVTYVVNPKMDFPSASVMGDHAYWLSGLTVRDRSAAAPRGTIDVISRAFGKGDPAPSATGTGAGTLSGNLGVLAFVSSFKTWGDAPTQPASNRLDIVARNIATLTVNPQRARVGCDALLNVDTDGPLTIVLDGCDRRVQY